MAILSLLVVLVAQLINSASATSKLQTQRLDADGQARLVFDRMALDFAGMVRRPDVDSSAYKYPNHPAQFKRDGNDGLLFFSQAISMGIGATVPQDAISLVGYRIYDSGADTENSFQLDRNGQGMEWSSSGGTSGSSKPAIPFLSFSKALTYDGSGAVSPTSYEIDDANSITKYWDGYDKFAEPDAMAGRSGNTGFHALSRDVFRLEFALLMKDGTFLDADELDFTKDDQRAFRDVQAIVATIAILDSASRMRLGATAYGTLKDVAGKLKDDRTGKAAENWTKTLLTDTSIPAVVTANARVYQRYFYLR